MNDPARREIRVVLFRLSDGWYGVDIMRVREVIRLSEYSRLISMPSFVAGFMARRGEWIPLIDLRERFGLPPVISGQQDRVLVVTLPGTMVGILADEATGVAPLPVSGMQPTPSLMRCEASAFFIGVSRVGERMVSLLNIDLLLSGEERLTLADLHLPDHDTDKGSQ
jgi:chemotaxis signal transduction protein